MNSSFSKMSDESYRARGGFENDELTYESSTLQIHHFLKRVTSRIEFAEVLTMMNLPMRQAQCKFIIFKTSDDSYRVRGGFENDEFTYESSTL